MTRCGYRAWTLTRGNGLGPLTVVSHDRYELTDDDFAELLEQYSALDVDALVITNSAARGFGERVVRSAQSAGIPLLTIDDFVVRVREPWT